MLVISILIRFAHCAARISLRSVNCVHLGRWPSELRSVRFAHMRCAHLASLGKLRLQQLLVMGYS